MAARTGGSRGREPSAATRGPNGPGSRRPTRAARAARQDGAAEEAPTSGAAPRRPSFTGRALVLLLVVAVLGVSYSSSIRAWLNQRSEENALSAQISAAKAQIAQLRLERSRWHDPAYIEAQARLRFGWVMPGERSYRVIGKDGKVWASGQSRLTPAPPAAANAAPVWWQGAVDSLAQADSTAPHSAKKSQPTRTPATRIGLGTGATGR